MCGIFAYIGDRQAANLLITALKRLEYRGYDSAGIGIQGVPLKTKKKVGKVSNLEDACGVANGELSGTSGIAHTRWATHGKPSDINSHPHLAGDRSIAVVHNGVIENYRTLKSELSKKGYIFVSETDTEVLVHLVQDLHMQMPQASWAQVVASALKLVEGAYGVVFLFEDDPDLLIGARKGSPLILGVGTGEHMLASDASAIVEHTQAVVYLRDGELVEVRRSNYKILTTAVVAETAKVVGQYTSPRPGEENPIVRLEMSLEQIEKAGYEHFMLKEIMDQPNALRNALRGRLYQSANDACGNGSWRLKLGGLEKVPETGDDKRTPIKRMTEAHRIIIVACGTSFHTGLIAKYTLESLARLPVEVEYASEFRYRRPIISSQDVVVAISQSGETADTLEAIRIAKEFKALTVGIVNVVGSSIARLTDGGVYLHAGPEIGVASTKAFTCQVVAVLMIALDLALQRRMLSEGELEGYCDALNKVPDLIEGWLDTLHKQTKVISKYFRLASTALFCGTGNQFPVALEGALKLKEISYIHAEGFPASEIRHGPFTLVSSFMPVVCIAFTSDPSYERLKVTINDLRAKGAALIVVTDEGNDDFNGICSFVIHCPATKLEFQPIMAVIPMQLLSYHIADMRRCNIDQPRNLAKSVTVE